MRPFADAMPYYAHAGWPCILPVPVVEKSPPPGGYTGADGADTTPAKLTEWAGTHGDWSIALRLPDGVIGIDVDHYDKIKTLPDGSTHVVQKRGADTLAERVNAWGPLPPTWSSTARGAGQPSRIMFYRVPPGRYRTTLGDAIEIIQRHHRYAVVWPSLNPDAGGARYEWYNPHGGPPMDGSVDPPVFRLPGPDDLPELPPAWVAGLREGATEAGPVASDEGSGRALLALMRVNEPEGPLCAELLNASEDAARKLIASSTGTRHDTATEQVYRLVQLGAAGHPGAAHALDMLAVLWSHLTAGENRGDEFERMTVTAARKAVTVWGLPRELREPCFTSKTITVPAPAPADNRPGELAPGAVVIDTPIEPPRELHPYAVIGPHQFNPKGHLDQVIASAVLDRTAPLLRYAWDAGVWLRRGPEAWDTRRDLAEWAIALLAELMPHGDPEAEKGSEPQLQAERRRRLMTAAPSGSVAKKMRALTAGGSHPSSVALGDLDREPWVLWAGGYPWDLARSQGGPALAAQIDPGTPHRHSAGVMPEARPTPLWDAYTAAVWPDPELRAWALRVLSIAVTGYSDKALPILVGDKDRGKTQVVALLMSVLGSYAHAADPRLLGSEITNAHPSIIYALMGRRLSFIDEGPREGKIGQERLKQLTGGGELTANAMHQDPVTWAPTHTLVLTANDEPTLTDPAIRGRVRLIPCVGDPAEVIRVRRAIGNPNGAAWRREAPGVLAAMMREAALWLADPDSASTLAAPEAYRYKADELAAEQDPVIVWLSDETVPATPGERANILYEAFRSWCQRNGVTAAMTPNRTRWGRALTALGFPAERDREGKTRPLRLRGPGGSAMPTSPSVMTFMGANPTVVEPVVTSPPAAPAVPPAQRSAPAENVTSRDPLVTGSTDNGSQTNEQVNPTISTLVTSVYSSDSIYSNNEKENDHVSQISEVTPKRVSTGHPVTAPPGRTDPTTVTLSKREQAKIKAAELRAAARLAAIEAAAGPRVALPAVVDRAGEIRSLTLPEAVAVVGSVIMETGQLTVDIEHSGFPVGHAEHELRTVQLGDESRGVVFDAGDPEQRRIVAAALGAAPRLHAHSATADLGPLVAAGLVSIEIWERMHDTAIRALLVDPQSTGSDPDLKRLSLALLGSSATAPGADKARAELFKAGKWLTDTELTTPRDRSGWSQSPRDCATMVRYAASDVLDTAAIVGRLPAVPDTIMERERAVQRITARVNHYGLKLDGDHVRAMLSHHRSALATATQRVNAFGVENPGSDQQVAAALLAAGAVLPLTPTGRPSVAASALEAIRATPGRVGELAAAVLDHRHHETVCSTFLEPFRRLIEHGDGRARPTIYTLGTDTGRMSCVRPNLQQLSREGGVRACITADPGYTLISADFAGVELRVAAALSGDANLTRIIAAGDDLHWRIAREVWGPEATKSDRYTAKRIVFGRLYGGGVPTLARQAGVSESVAASAVDVLDSITPGLSAWSRAIRDMVKRGATQFPSYSGRIIWLPKDYPHKGPNYCIQGSARELLVDALIRWDATAYGGGVILPVHDEIVAVVPEGDAEKATATLVECMTSNLMGVDIRAEASEPSVSWRDSV